MQYSQKGQILLIVVLVMVTALTVGLAVAVRSVSNTKTSEDAASSEKAFSAAEAGIERSLTSDTSVSGSFSNNASYTTTIQTVNGLQFALNNGSAVLKDGSTDLWLSKYPGYTNQWTGTFTIYWGQSTDVCNSSEANNTEAALEILVFSGSLANPQLTRYDYDPCTARQLVNHFTFVNSNSYSIAGRTYRYSTPLITVTNGLFARIIPLYAPAYIASTNCGCQGGFPPQGTVIQAVGNSASTERKIVTYQYYPSVPSEILQYSLFVSQ